MNPGVGDYDIAQTQLNLLKKGSNATIGNGERFQKNKLKEYVEKVPLQYINEADKVQAKPAKLGTFSNEKRWQGQATI